MFTYVTHFSPPTKDIDMHHLKSLYRYTAGIALLLHLMQPAYAGEFSLVVIPDTQFASDSLSEDFPGGIHPFNAQTRWIRDNAASRNIKFTAHVGDIVNNRSIDHFPTSQQWQIADAAMGILDQKDLAYGVARGNHDNDLEGFREYFGPDRFATVPSYRGSDPGALQSYHKFEAEGQQFAVLFTDWRMAANELKWAKNVLNNNASTPTFLVSHSILNVEQGAPPPANVRHTPNGEAIWDELVRENDQVFMTLSGHHTDTGWRVKENDFGRDVIQMVVDFQFDQWDGAGYLRELVFGLDNDTIEGITFSPWIDEVRKTFPDATWPFDPNAIDPRITSNRKNDEAHQFLINMDFEERFTIVPEPSSVLILGITVSMLVSCRRRRR